MNDTIVATSWKVTTILYSTVTTVWFGVQVSKETFSRRFRKKTKANKRAWTVS